MGGGWSNPDYGFDPQGMLSGAGGLLGGLFGNSGNSYDKAMEQYQKYGQMGQNAQQSYQDAGKSGLNNYQDWLSGQKDPSSFINNLMNNYQESPYAHNLQQQSQNAGQNAASASGLMGSTPMMQQLQQDSSKISSGDMNQWLQNVLGINTQYGQGEKNLVDTGQNSTNALTDMFNNLGNKMGEGAYGKEAGKQQNFWNTLGGVGSMIGSFL